MPQHNITLQVTLHHTARQTQAATKHTTHTDRQFFLYVLQAEVQQLTRKVSAAESAATAAAAAASESRQAAAAAEAELQTLRGAAARVESELRAQLADSRAARDAEVSGLASKLERALAACDKAVADAGEMMAGKEGLLAEWKKEAQLVSVLRCWGNVDGGVGWGGECVFGLWKGVAEQAQLVSVLWCWDRMDVGVFACTRYCLVCMCLWTIHVTMCAPT